MKIKPQRYNTLYKLIEHHKPRILFEIGTYDGQNAAKMIAAAKKAKTKNIEYYGFDLFEDISSEEINHEHSKKIPATFKKAEQNLRSSMINGDRFFLFRGYTQKTLPNLKNVVADFIFIDGGHSIETIQSDWNNCQKFIEEHTVIVFDDYYFDRMDLGCCSLINSLHVGGWLIEPLQPIDIFPQANGWLQHTQLVKVTLA